MTGGSIYALARAAKAPDKPGSALPDFRRVLVYRGGGRGHYFVEEDASYPRWRRSIADWRNHERAIADLHEGRVKWTAWISGLRYKPNPDAIRGPLDREEIPPMGDDERPPWQK